MTTLSDTEKAVAEARFVVDEIGPKAFAVHDNVSQLDYDLSFTRKAAQRAADRRNTADACDYPQQGSAR